VVAIPPGGYNHTRLVCRQLRARAGTIPIVGAILTEGDPQELKGRQPPLLADAVAVSLAETVRQVRALLADGSVQARAELVMAK
jgi:hypothetical protein